VRLAALAALVAGASLAVVPANATVSPARVQVSAKEFWFALSRRTVIEGPAIVELVNFGEDPHDLRLQRVGGTKVHRTPIVQPGKYFDLSLKLVPGRYKLWCSVANHASRGMRSMLIVRKRQ
jgi:plastocyanin